MLVVIESDRHDAAMKARRENAKETAIQLLKESLSVEQIARCSSALSIDEIRMQQENRSLPCII